MYKVIDCRLRPPFGSWLKWFYTNVEGTDKFLASMFDYDFSEIKPNNGYVLNKSMDLLIEEMDAANIVMAFAESRMVPGTDTTNKDIEKLQETYPGRFSGFAHIMPLEYGVDAALEEIKKYVIDGPAFGIALEPALDHVPYAMDDERIFPIYELCQEKNIPVIFTWGGVLARNHKDYDASILDHTALMFPKMKIMLCHSGWPYVTETIHVAYMRQNIWLCPEAQWMLGFFSGTHDLCTAANHMLKNRIVFGTASPGPNLKSIVDAYINNPLLKKEILPKLFYDNAMEFLTLNLNN